MQHLIKYNSGVDALRYYLIIIIIFIIIITIVITIISLLNLKESVVKGWERVKTFYQSEDPNPAQPTQGRKNRKK